VGHLKLVGKSATKPRKVVGKNARLLSYKLISHYKSAHLVMLANAPTPALEKRAKSSITTLEKQTKRRIFALEKRIYYVGKEN
jgi:hypothetical protein